MRMFRSECLGNVSFESTAAAILMDGYFLSFLVECLGICLVQWHGSKRSEYSTEVPVDDSLRASTEMVNLSVLEAGVIFHSLRKCLPSRPPCSAR
jgi:solute carrier family 39 (zinc transporter), member 1/2/3